MTVKASELDNPEKDQVLENREPRGARDVVKAIERVKKGGASAEDELRTLRARIAAAKSNEPEDPLPHCRDCFSRGVRATVRAIEGVIEG